MFVCLFVCLLFVLFVCVFACLLARRVENGINKQQEKTIGHQNDKGREKGGLGKEWAVCVTES